MSPAFGISEPVFGCHSSRGLAACFVAAGAIFAISSPALASIVLPEISGYTLEENAAVTESLGAGSASADEPVQDCGERESELQLVKDAFSPGGTSSSGTSTSPSGGGNGGVGASTLDYAVAVHFSDSASAGWVPSEQRFSLAMPPCNDLLRPPQVG